MKLYPQEKQMQEKRSAHYDPGLWDVGKVKKKADSVLYTKADV